MSYNSGNKNELTDSKNALNASSLPPIQTGAAANISAHSVEEDQVAYPMDNSEYDKVSIHSKAKSGRSKKSAGADTSASTNSVTGGGGKQVADTGARKLVHMVPTVIALVFHVIYLAVLLLMHSETGWVLPFNVSVFVTAGPIIFEVWGLLCYVLMDIALNDSLSAFLGYLLSRKEGFSIAVCGFNQASLLGKIQFPNLLSFRSTAKPLLSKLSLLWLAHLGMIILNLVASTGIQANGSRIDKGALMCLSYSQGYLYPTDRGIPTLVAKMGGAELIDGTAIGYLRATDPTLEFSTQIVSPQLTDACQDGSSIVGNGISAEVYTTCQCSVSSSKADLMNAGLDAEFSTEAATYAGLQSHAAGWVNTIKNGDDVVNMTTILTGSHVCGGHNSSSPAVAVCKTQIKNHQQVAVLVTYKTDGTPASIAAKTLEVLGDARSESLGITRESLNMTWMYVALKNLYGGEVSHHLLPGHWPGSINPLLWMTSTNMQDVTMGLLEPGMEAAIALLMQASIQRSYTVTGGFCTQNIEDPLTVTMTIKDYAFLPGLIWIIFQLIVNMVAFAGYVPWLINHHPILPAIQICQDQIILSLLSAKNAVITTRMKGLTSNFDSNIAWPKMDIVLRIGESILTAEDPERGVILMDKPKMVTDMSYDKVYV